MPPPFFTLESSNTSDTPAGGRVGQVVWFAALILGLCMLYQANLAAGQEVNKVNTYQVEAAFLRNFAHFVIWPPHAFNGNETPWHIGILGSDPFGEVLEGTFRGHTEQGRSFEIYRADRLDELPSCQIIFIAHQDPVKRRAVLDRLKDQPVLTVGEASDFLKEGGIIRFQVGDRVKMSVNLDQARAVSLKIQTKMLEVSDQVMENGLAQKTR